jgi:chaperonin cofactor prefoldin
MKALLDQDKAVASLKQRVKQLEKECSTLKNENRSLQVREEIDGRAIYD